MNNNLGILYAESSVGSSRPITKRFTKDGSITWIQELLTFGRPTRNGFTFVEEEFVDAINTPYVQDRINGKRFYGELDHPSKSDPDRFITVNLQNIAIRYNRIWIENHTLFAECETVNSPSGDIVRGMIESGAEIAVSYRGYGVPKPEGGENIVIVAWDVVFQPSDPTATSKENTFKDKMYAEGHSIDAMINKAIALNMCTFDAVPKTGNFYAEASAGEMAPSQIVRLGEEVVGFTFVNKKELATKKTYNEFTKKLKFI